MTHGITGVDVTTYPVLSGVDRLGPTTATRLALTIGPDRSATTRYASRLEEAGLIERRADPDDGRATQLTLTAAGIAAVARMRAELGVAVGEILSGWDEAEASAFADGLRRITDQLTGPSDPPED